MTQGRTFKDQEWLMHRSWGGQEHKMLERREGQCACSPRVGGSVGWEGPREVSRSQTMVGCGEEPDCVLGTMAQERALEAVQALGCLLNP